MPVNLKQVGGKKLHKKFCDLVSANESMTTTEIRTALDKSKSHTIRAMWHLTNNGYFVAHIPERSTSITWTRTDKEFIYEPKVKQQPKPKIPKQPKVKAKPKVVKKPCKPIKQPKVKLVKPKPLKLKPIQTAQITIKPDLAAMWLVSSKPQWETKSIPIVRSTELGARRSTF